MSLAQVQLSQEISHLTALLQAIPVESPELSMKSMLLRIFT